MGESPTLPDLYDDVLLRPRRLLASSRSIGVSPRSLKCFKAVRASFRSRTSSSSSSGVCRLGAGVDGLEELAIPRNITRGDTRRRVACLSGAVEKLPGDCGARSSEARRYAHPARVSHVVESRRQWIP